MLDKGFYNMDCMEALREFPDGFFELAVVDPPYGDGGGYMDERGTIRAAVRQVPEPYRGGGGTANRHITSGLRKGQSPPNWWNMGGEVRKKS